MELGNFSVSLAVRDIVASRDFYLALGFRIIHGDVDHNWLILANGPARVGLFQGMFERNTLTFNPGWDPDARPLEGFDDVRAIRAALVERGIAVQGEIDAPSGPGHFMVFDPDGNPILFDQHV